MKHLGVCSLVALMTPFLSTHVYAVKVKTVVPQRVQLKRQDGKWVLVKPDRAPAARTARPSPSDYRRLESKAGSVARKFPVNASYFISFGRPAQAVGAFLENLQDNKGNERMAAHLAVDPFLRELAGTAPGVSPQLKQSFFGAFDRLVPKNALLSSRQIVLLAAEERNRAYPAALVQLFHEYLRSKGAITTNKPKVHVLSQSSMEPALKLPGSRFKRTR